MGALTHRRRALLSNGKIQFCEWIGARKDCVIPLGLIFNIGDKVEFTFNWTREHATDATANQRFFGAYDNTSSEGITKRLHYSFRQNYSEYGCGSAYNTFGGTVNTDIDVTLSIEVNSNAQTFIKTIAGGSPNITNTQYNLTQNDIPAYEYFLFGRSVNGQINTGDIWKSNNLIRFKHLLWTDIDGNTRMELKPCYKKGSIKIGVYDLISKRFIGNELEGTLEKGSDVE